MLEIQLQLLQLHNQMFISPEDFSYRWDVGYETLGEICCLSKSTTYHWLGGRASRRMPSRSSQRILAVADLLLANAEQVYPLLERWRSDQAN